MKQALIDTDILSMFFHGDPNVVARFDTYATLHGTINTTIITYYEIVSGLKHRGAQKQMAAFLEFAAQNNIVPLTEASVMLSADLYAALRARGMPIDDIDLLIAGVALASGWTLVTHNRKHFDRIEGLQVEDWSAP
ncbi:MAG TPA: type II toxin-antitoxin system VapC family toxin [Anaerolineae bacterium]|nr:type II toxin-antitoxin system VapC family toxin [Anaerolineae bacterium]HOQ98972.1 type II toxin-antitoxin system VapC family toxin [Anaerolineae bacterium]HPL29052.1 type II toxin-antitoxin system VapC family toxin [Anaerolineae bacterium]